MDDCWRDNPGCWNAYVETATSVEEARARLAEAPERLRVSIVSHVRMVKALAQAAREKRERAEARRRQREMFG